MDPELRAASDDLRRHVDETAAETRQQVEATAAETRRHVDETAAETRQQVEATAVETRRHVDETAAETRRHFGILAEGLRSDVQLVAEGVTGLSERVDRLEVSLRDDMLGLQRELGAMLRFSYAELDRKIQSLETRVSELGHRYADLESRLHRVEATLQ